LINQVHHMDCLSGMDLLSPASVDFVFADLPYGRTMNDWDKLIPMEVFWSRIKRVCKPTAAIVFTSIQPFTSLLIVSNPKWFRYEIIWKKNKSTGFLNAKKRPLRSHENVLVFWDEEPTYKPQMTEGHEPGHAVTNQLSRTTCYGKTPVRRSWGGKTSRYPTTVLELSIVNNDDPARIHPTQKPEALSAWFMRTYTKSGDVVLDPTFGSGTTLLAAKKMGRKFVGFDIDKRMVVAVSNLLEAVV
jgi:DNA modification methylase